MVRILITDIQYRKTFDIINILKKEFPEYGLMLGTNEDMGACKARLCYGSHFYEPIRTSNQNFLNDDLNQISRKYSNDTIIYIPVEERTTDFFIEYLEKYGNRNFRYLLPSSELYHKFRNKKALNDFCLDNGFPAPRKYDAKELLNPASYPLILKPAVGSGSKGIVRLQHPNELSEHLKLEVENGNYVAQELIPDGKNVHGVFLLYKDGERLGVYTHRRLRTSPEEGGVTVLSEMTYEETLIQQASDLLNFAKWNGLVMLEYLWDEKSHTYKLIEANPRLWGSIMLSEYGGAGLLTNYVRACIGEMTKQPHIRKGVKIRWFFPMDILYFIKKKGKVGGFWNFSDTCFINWTYANKFRALAFLILNIFSLDNFKKVLGKL